MPNARRFDAVLFDLDDTLLDWSQRSYTWDDFLLPKITNMHAHLVAPGRELPPPADFAHLFRERIRHSWEEAKKDWSGISFAGVLGQVLDELGLDRNDLDLEAAMRAFEWSPHPGVVPFPDTIPVLQTLRRRGYQLGLVTNSFHPMWMRDIELAYYELLEYFDARVTSGDTGYMKPHPAIFRRALNLLGTTADRSVFVGDRPENDIAGANEAGIISVLMAPPHLNRELNGSMPDYTISALSELLPILDELERLD